MSNFGDKVQPAVKKETKNVAIYTVVGVVCDVGRVSDPAPDSGRKKSHLTIG